MKKTLLFVVAALFAAYTTNAQTLFSEDFENDLSAWTLYDEDGDGNDWRNVDVSGSEITAHGGTHVGASHSYLNGSALTPDNWMVTTNAITVPGTGFVLTWYDASQDPSWPEEKYSVYVSTTGNTVADFTDDPVFTITLSTNEWTMRTVDFSAYAGQQIYIAFRHYDCTDMFWFKVDDITLAKPLTEPEITITSLTTPATVDINTPFTMSGVVTNPSTVALTSFKVSYTLDGENSGDITISGINVPLGGTYAFSHTSPAFVTEAGVHNFSVTVSEPNGTADNTADNTLEGSILACGTITHMPYSEDFTGTNCWQTIDNDGDGNNWGYMNVGLDAILSFSYNYNTDAPLTPDNWLISPAIQVPETGNYYALWYDFNLDGDYLDSYSVYLANSNSISALTAGELGSITPDTVPTMRNIDLASHAGEVVYIAFRHWNVSDLFGMGIAYFNVLDPNVTFDTIEVVSADELMGTVSGGDVYEDGAEVTITATPKPGYRFVNWNGSITDNPYTFTAEANATYTANFEPTSSQGINDVNATNVNLYPNPTSGNLYVEVEGLQKVEIIDAVGRVVLSQNNGTVNMSNLANGIYTVRVSANGTTSVKKVVKK